MTCIFPCGVYRIAAAVAAGRLRLWGTYRIDIVDADPEAVARRGRHLPTPEGWTEPRDRRRLVDPIRVKTYLRSVSCRRPGALGAQGRPGPLGCLFGVSTRFAGRVLVPWCLLVSRRASVCRVTCPVVCGLHRALRQSRLRRPYADAYDLRDRVRVPFIFMPPRIKSL